MVAGTNSSIYNTRDLFKKYQARGDTTHDKTGHLPDSTASEVINNPNVWQQCLTFRKVGVCGFVNTL